MATDDQRLVDLLEQVWGSIDAVCSDLAEEQWKTATDLPGWSVQDNVVHIVGIESSVLGRPAPDHTPPEFDHVKNDVGRRNEVWVDSRRSWPGARVLEEFHEITSERLHQLRGFSEADFGASSWTPAGPGTVRDLLPFRVFDSWTHEQDIRRALGRPGGLDGPVAETTFATITGAMPYVVGKKVKPSDGTTVVLEITGPHARTLPIGVEGGRARVLDSVPPNPVVVLTMDSETFACLGCGRWDPTRTLDERKITIRGDDALGRAVVEQMNFLF